MELIYKLLYVIFLAEEIRMILTIVLLVLFFGLLLALAICSSQNKELRAELSRKKEFIDKYLLVVRFPSQYYVFPYVWGTRQQKVFMSTSDALSSATPTFSIVDAEEAKRRITLEHRAQMEEVDRLGI